MTYTPEEIKSFWEYQKETVIHGLHVYGPSIKLYPPWWAKKSADERGMRLLLQYTKTGKTIECNGTIVSV